MTSMGDDPVTEPRDDDDDAERQAIADVDEELDERSDEEGLAAEAGRGEENGLAEG